MTHVDTAIDADTGSAHVNIFVHADVAIGSGKSLAYPWISIGNALSMFLPEDPELRAQFLDHLVQELQPLLTKALHEAAAHRIGYPA